MSRPRVSTHRALTPKTDQERAFYRARLVALVAELIAGLVEEVGPAAAFSPDGAEAALVRHWLALVREAGGLDALDAVARRIRRHLAEDELDPDGGVMRELGRRIADVAASDRAHGATR
jgi:hypothetical protein